MEFPFNVSDVLRGRITIIESKDSTLQIYDAETTQECGQGNNDTNLIYTFSSNSPWDVKIKRRTEELESIVDSIGFASAQAQDLQSPITTLKKMFQSNKHKLYIMKDIEEPKCVIGMLKVGIKRLFVCDNVGAHHEVDPLCVLDFYIHESKQRCGYGHELFDIMLKIEGITPEKLAIDRPSYKCLQFLQKHYSLNNPIQQNNNFVIYPGFLKDRPVTRPPIFLYSGKVMTRPYSRSIPKTSDSVQSLQSVPVCLSSSDIKSKSFSSGNFLNLNNCEGNQQNHRRQKAVDVSTPIPNSHLSKGEKKGVQKVLHSYTSSFDELDDWKRFSTKSVLTPVDSFQRYSKKNWDQLQSSWNVLGVKPVDYPTISKKS